MAAAETPNPRPNSADCASAIPQQTPADGGGLDNGRDGGGAIPQQTPADGGGLGDSDDAWLVYDGECPLCSAYARRVGEDAGDAGGIALVNARAGGPQVAELRRRAYDPDAGMALKLGGQYYFGSAALHRLAQLSAGRGALGCQPAAVPPSPRRPAVLPAAASRAPPAAAAERRGARQLRIRN